MVNFEASHWSRALLVFFPTHLRVEGFVIYGWGLSIFIRDVGDDVSVRYMGPYLTNPSDKPHPRLFVTSGWDLSYVGGFVIYGWGLSYLGGICHMWGDLSYKGGVCQYLFATLPP